MGSKNTDSPRSGEKSQFQFELNGATQPSTAVVEAVAAVTDRNSTEMEPIHHSIDTDALDRLFDPENGTTEGSINVAFRYEGVDVLINSLRGIEVQTDPEDDTVSRESESV